MGIFAATVIIFIMRKLRWEKMTQGSNWVRRLYKNTEESSIWSDETPELNYHWAHLKLKSISVKSLLCSQTGKSEPAYK